jgi:hypothetical protein
MYLAIIEANTVTITAIFPTLVGKGIENGGLLYLEMDAKPNEKWFKDY